MINIVYRPPSEAEQNLLNLLTAADFPGAAAARQQLSACLVRPLDSEGSLQLQVPATPLADVKFRIPVELYANDLDGTPVHVLLHVINGRCSELEIYKDAPTPVLALPSQWEYFIPTQTI